MSETTTTRVRRRGIGSGALPRAIGPVVPVLARVSRVLTVLLAALCLVSALVLVPLSAVNGSWVVTVFDSVVLVASVFALLTGLGRFEDGPALSLLCCGGAIGSLALLAEPTLVSRLLGASGRPLVIGGIKLSLLMYGRVGAGAFMVMTAALLVWARDAERSVAYLVRSAAVLIPGVLIVLVSPIPKPSFLSVFNRAASMIGGLPSLVGTILAIVGFFLVLGFVSAGGHCLIRSFEVGRLEDGGSEKGGGSGGSGAGAGAAASAAGA